jgi:hypothetical protein
VSSASSGPHQFAAFCEHVARFPGLWRSIDVRYSAVRVGNSWVNLLTDARLSLSTPQVPETESFVELPALRAGRVSLPISELERVVRDAEANRATFNGTEIELVGGPPGAGVGPSIRSFQPFYRLAPALEGWRPFWDPGRESATLTLIGHGDMLSQVTGHDLWLQLEGELQAHSPPYFGLEDLFRYFIRSTSTTGFLGMASCFSLRAPLYSWIEDLSFGEGPRLVVLVRCPATTPGGTVRLVARGVKDDKIERYDISGQPQESGSDELQLIPISLDVSQASWIEGAVLLRGTKFDQFVFNLPLLNSPNPRYEAVHTTDVGDRRLREFVEGNPSTGQLENSQLTGVGWLLQLCGFQVLVSGLSGLNMGSAPDLFAFVPFAHSALVIEATRRDLAGEGKLVRLHDRAEALRARLGDFDILPLAVTAKGAITDPEWELAERLGIKVLAQPGLGTLLQMAERNESAGRVFDHLKQLGRPL